MAEIYRAITGTPYSNNPEANWFIQKLYQLIYDMARTAGSYQEALEGVIQEAWVNRSSAFQLLRSLCGALSRNGEADAMLLGEAPKADALLSVFLYDLAMEELGLRPSSWNDLNLMMQLFYEHCPEVYISWMMSQSDPAHLFVTDTAYRRIFLDSRVDYALLDEDRQPVDAVCAASLGRTVMITVPSSRTYTLALSAGTGGERVKVVEYAAGSLHYAYQLYELDSGGTYELTLPMEFWVNRQGIFYGPFSPIYGLGVCIFVIFLGRNAEKRSWLKTWAWSALIGGCTEYATSLIAEKIFGSTIWDYSNIPLNINGRTTLPFMVFWGLGGMVLMKLAYPFISKWIEKIPAMVFNQGE